MNYRRVYMRIVTHAKKEEALGIRKRLPVNDPNYIYYEKHHILPRSLFPNWAKRKSNLVLLTAREHFFCHQLLTKIYPSFEMENALSFFTSLKQKRALTSRQYEICRKAAHNANLLFWKKNNELILKMRAATAERAAKSKWYNDGQNEYFVTEPKDGWVKGRLKLSKDEHEKRVQKMRETRANRTPEEKALEYKRRSESNKKFPRKRNYTIGMHWYNNGIENKKFFSCPQGWQEGKLTHKEGKKVICLETGEVFYKKDLPGVHKNCNGYRNSYKGLHYQWYSESLEGGVSESLSST